MECKEVRPMLSAYIDGEVPIEEAERIEEHLSSCSSCALELEGLKSVTGALASATELEPPAFLLARIEGATIGRKKRGLRIRVPSFSIPRFAGWAAAVVAVIGMLIGGLANHGGRPSTSPQIALQPKPSVKTEVRPAVTTITRAIVVAKAPMKHVDAQRIRPSRSTPARFHHRHGLPEGKPSDGYLAPQLAARPKADARQVNPEPYGQTDSDSPVMAEIDPVAPDPKPTRMGVRVAAALTSVNASAETAALEELRSSIAPKNRHRRTRVYPDNLTGERYSVGIASIRF